MRRRALSEMLVEVSGGALTALTGAPGIRPRRLDLTLPIEIWVHTLEGDPLFLADLPIWRWRTDFDQTPSQLHLVFEEGETS
jgi:hypothetical protein